MATHGRSHLSQSNTQETGQKNTTRLFQEMAHAYINTTGYQRGRREDDRTIGYA